MKHIIRLILLPILVGISTWSLANEPSKIGALDWQQLLSKAPQAEEAGKRLEREFQAPKERLINKQKEFQTKRDKLGRDKDILSAGDRAKKEKELGKLEQDLRHMDEELRQDYSNRHREEMDDFIKLVKEVVDKIAKEDKYDLIIPQEATLFIADRIDLTEKVLERLSKMKANTKPEKAADKKSD